MTSCSHQGGSMCCLGRTYKSQQPEHPQAEAPSCLRCRSSPVSLFQWQHSWLSNRSAGTYHVAAASAKKMSCARTLFLSRLVTRSLPVASPPFVLVESAKENMDPKDRCLAPSGLFATGRSFLRLSFMPSKRGSASRIELPKPRSDILAHLLSREWASY